jgi:glycosyltransferase involved in cell wall biosynthesis
LDDPELRQSFGRAAALRARDEFSLESMTSRTLALYERVAANS